MSELDSDDITETAGDLVTEEQIQRIVNRYAWAADYCHGHDVFELACGTGQGLGLLKRRARSIVAGDLSREWLRRVSAHYGARIPVLGLDARRLPLRTGSVDVIVFFETLYFVDDQEAVVSECRRVLRKGGRLLLASVNPDAPDFHRYKFASRYHGVSEMNEFLGRFGFECDFFGDTRLQAASGRQRLLRAAKLAAGRLGVMPASKALKRVLKRFFYGRLRVMPAEIDERTLKAETPTPLSSIRVDRAHRIYLCAARAGS